MTFFYCNLGSKGWRSGESTCLPPMWPGFKSRHQRIIMWFEFVVGSLFCSERFFSGYSGFPLSSKTNISKFQFNQELLFTIYLILLQTTRSGRMVKPPLAWWRGQRILTDRHHNLEGIDPGGEEHTPISPMYSVDFKLPLKVRLPPTL